jgi:hypothetical protein
MSANASNGVHGAVRYEYVSSRGTPESGSRGYYLPHVSPWQRTRAA